MPLVPIRNLGQYGVNADVDPLDLPANIFSAASNVRFVDNKIGRGPVFSKVGHSTVNTAPRWTFSYRLQSASAQYLVFNEDGTTASLGAPAPGAALTYTDKTLAAYVPSAQQKPYTTTLLSNVVYVNREDRVPWYMTPSDTAFQGTLADWNSGWRCKSLRSFNGCLVAINVTKGATAYPQMVKTSDFAPFAATPTSWTASPTNSATENVLSDLTEALVDGWSLRDKFILYTNNETWQMVPSGDNFIYSYQRLFANYGVISQNCVADVNNQHFVFGDNDIWMHDGFQPKSIANGRVRRFIFDNLVRSQAYQFFVWSNPKLNEIMFCYVSTDPYCAFPAINNAGCNKAAVYNWAFDTWQFYDLPYIVGGGLGEMATGLTYADVGSISYETMGGSYAGLYDDTRLFNLCVGRGGEVFSPVLPLQTIGSWVSGTHLYSFEPYETITGYGEFVAVVNPPAFVENTQMDMDEVFQELRGYKLITTIYPEGRLTDSTKPMTFWHGSCDYSSQEIIYGEPMTFDGQCFYKLDFNSPGRYLSLRMAMASPQKFTLSGMDIEAKVVGHR